MTDHVYFRVSAGRNYFLCAAADFLELSVEGEAVASDLFLSSSTSLDLEMLKYEDNRNRIWS